VERFAAAFEFARTYTDIDRMFEVESLDAVVAVTPVPKTRELVGDLLAREIPLLFEKPPGRDSRETRELREIAAIHDTPHMISFNR
jgi:predicted dehydrogenase